jgi:hypothetical protein
VRVSDGGGAAAVAAALLQQNCDTSYAATGVHILMRVGETALDIAASQLLNGAPHTLTDSALAVAEAAVEAATARVAAAIAQQRQPLQMHLQQDYARYAAAAAGGYAEQELDDTCSSSACSTTA